MDRKEIEQALINEGYHISDFAVFTADSEKLANLKRGSVEVVYDDFHSSAQVEEKADLVVDLQRLDIPYTEVLDKEAMKILCGTRDAKNDFKSYMVLHAKRLLSLAERVDGFEFK